MAQSHIAFGADSTVSTLLTLNVLTKSKTIEKQKTQAEKELKSTQEAEAKSNSLFQVIRNIHVGKKETDPLKIFQLFLMHYQEAKKTPTEMDQLEPIVKDCIQKIDYHCS